MQPTYPYHNTHQQRLAELEVLSDISEYLLIGVELAEDANASAACLPFAPVEHDASAP